MSACARGRGSIIVPMTEAMGIAISRVTPTPSEKNHFHRLSFQIAFAARGVSTRAPVAAVMAAFIGGEVVAGAAFIRSAPRREWRSDVPDPGGEQGLIPPCHTTVCHMR